MLKLTRCALLVTSVLTVSSAVYADGMKNMNGMNMSQPTEERADGTGIIKAIDKAAATVTISHHPIKAFAG